MPSVSSRCSRSSSIRFSRTSRPSCRNILGLTANQALWSTTLANAVVLVTCLAAGAISDWVGRKPLMLIHCFSFLVLTYPLMWFLLRDGASLTTVVAIQAFLGVLTGLFLGSFPAALVELFPTRQRPRRPGHGLQPVIDGVRWICTIRCDMADQSDRQPERGFNLCNLRRDTLDSGRTASARDGSHRSRVNLRNLREVARCDADKMLGASYKHAWGPD